jgi:hypothetical protein
VQERVNAIAEEIRAKRTHHLSDEERHRIMESWVAEGDAKRGYALTPEQKERLLFQYLFEGRVIEKWKRASAWPSATEHRYGQTPAPYVREGGRGETQLDRIERALTATRIQLEALESRVQLFVDHSRAIAAKLEELSVRVDALTHVVERIDLRVLSVEHRMQRLEQHVERLEQPEDS